MSRTVRLTFLVALLLASLAVASWRLFRAEEVQAFQAPASWIHAAGLGAEEGDVRLLFDGRRQGALPYGLRPRGAGPFRLDLTLPVPEAIGAVVVSWDGAPPTQAFVRVAGIERPLAQASDAESFAFLPAPARTDELTLTYTPAAGTRGVAEIELMGEQPGLLLFAPRMRADRDAELLETYGYPHLTRLPLAALGSATGLDAARLAVSSTTLSGEERAQLRRLVTLGAWLVELGPEPAVCSDLPSTPEPTGELVLRGSGLDGVQVDAALRALAGCGPDACPDAEVLAWAGPAQGRPWAVRQALGRGHCTRVMADLVDVVQRLRQGDPARRNVAPSSENVFKPWDLFAGRDPDGLIPHADRLGYALAFWVADAPGPDVLVAPLPSARGGLVVWTADQDYVPGPGLVAQGARMGPGGMTMTLTDASLGAPADVRFDEGDPGLLPRAFAAELSEQGHELGLHPALMGVPPQDHARVLAEAVRAFEKAYDVRPRILRNHHLVWSGYVDMAEAAARAGIAMDLDYVTGPGPRGYQPGFMTGSGLAMRFGDERGQLLPIYQQATQVDDYVFAAAGSTHVDPKVTRGLIAGAVDLLARARRERTALTVLHHPAWWFATDSAFQDALLAEATKQGDLVWPAGRWLRFVEARRMTRVARTEDGGFFLTSPAAPLAVWLEGAGGTQVDVRGRRFALRELSDASAGVTLR